MTSVRFALRIVCFLFICLHLIPGLAAAQKETITIIFDTTSETFRFTAGEMKKNLEKGGYTVMLAATGSVQNTISENRFVLTVRNTPASDNLLHDPAVAPLPALKSQGYSLRKKNHPGYTDWYITGVDAKGVIYGGLDISETVQLKGLQALAEIDKEPYINNRGIKFNIPLDARTPSYSDNADAARQNIANMWDLNFWHEFLDEMARDRFNMLSLWSLSPFPSLVDVPEYPNAGLNDVMKTTDRLLPTTDATFMSTPASLARLVTLKKITLSGKIKFWKHIMQYANDRGIDCYLFTWNLFVYGTENSGYGFTDKISDAKSKDYIRKATKALLQTYPLLKGIGLTAGENMMKQSEGDKEKFLYESYGEGINDALAADPERKFRLIHRAHQADIDMIKKTFSGLNPGCSLDFSYKYSVAQMYSSVAPQYIYESQFLEHIGNSKFFLTVREDAWYNLRGGSDPAFARAYFKNIPKNNFEGFYTGPDGYTLGREYISKTPGSPCQLVLKKRWYSFRILGKLAYDPETPDTYFTALLHDRFPGVNAGKLAVAWASASQIMPLVNRFHNGRSQNDYQWYPEGCTSFYGFRTINSFIKCAPQKGEDIIGIPEYSNAVLKNQTITGTSPVAVAAELKSVTDHALLLVAELKTGKDKELHQTMQDIRAMSFLGQYYSKKILGAVNKDLYEKAAIPSQKTEYKKAAIKNLEEAAGSWRRYATTMSSLYTPQHLTRMHFTVDFKAIQAHVDKEVAMMKMMDGKPAEKTATNTKPLTEDIEVVFSPNSNYYFWHLDKLGLPENWSSFKYVEVEVFATSKQAFDLFLKAGEDTIIKRGIKPAANGLTSVVVPFESFKLLSVKKRVIAGSAHETAATTFSMNEITDFGVSMEKPLAYPVLEIRSVKLSKEEPGTTQAVSIVHY